MTGKQNRPLVSTSFRSCRIFDSVHLEHNHTTKGSVSQRSLGDVAFSRVTVSSGDNLVITREVWDRRWHVLPDGFHGRESSVWFLRPSIYAHTVSTKE